MLAMPTPAASAGEGEKSAYEKKREERIRGNLVRMHQLGIPDLSLKVSSMPQSQRQSRAKRPRESVKFAVSSSPPGPRRRSSRLQNLTPVSYDEIRSHGVKDSLVVKEFIREGERPEIYTEEHEKLLGTCEKEWVLFVDGVGSNGSRIYDQVRGKTCHQCRQKTLGHRTTCSSCNIVQGQFCGDCLFMRYGENVLEANQNPNWICPVCRGICNCSLCRIKKGWAPTGSLYRKICGLGYKSVAHYLIQTLRANPEAKDSQFAHPAKRSLPFTDSCGTSQVDTTGDSEKLDSESIQNVASLTGNDLIIDSSISSDAEIIGLEKLAGHNTVQTFEVSSVPKTPEQDTTSGKLRCKTKVKRASGSSAKINPHSIKLRLRPPRPLTVLN